MTRPRDLQPGNHVLVIRAWQPKSTGRAGRIIEIGPEAIVIHFDDAGPEDRTRLDPRDNDHFYEIIE